METNTSANRLSLETLLPRVFHSLAANPLLLLPPLAHAFVDFAVLLGFIWLLAEQTGAKLARLRWAGPSALFEHFPRFGVQILLYAATLLILYLFIRSLVGALNGAGWGRMLERAAAGAPVSPAHYLEGVALFLPRFVEGAALRRCISFVPFLALLVIILSFASLAPDSPLALFCLLFGFPLILLADSAAAFLLALWKPLLFLDDVSVVDAFRKSLDLAGRHRGLLLTVLSLRTLFTLAVAGACAGAIALLLANLQTPDTASLRFFLLAGVLIFSWIAHLIGAAVSSLLVQFVCLDAAGQGEAPDSDFAVPAA